MYKYIQTTEHLHKEVRKFMRVIGLLNVHAFVCLDEDQSLVFTGHFNASIMY